MSLHTTIKSSILLLAGILLIGVILMGFGYYNQHSLLILIGVLITFFTSLMITIQNLLIQKKSGRHQSHDRLL